MICRNQGQREVVSFAGIFKSRGFAWQAQTSTGAGYGFDLNPADGSGLCGWEAEVVERGPEFTGQSQWA